ncbi:uncharacterized protein LOC128633618 [Ictalurus punctatus]|uniref:Uncharacterized protein LOC128633618 n=1 Tax=Ictalurus punctatus TaxID=7998 RepID=A0A9F7TKR8_ICTPU|nr:uncharacterized protein LOC128633618 [Ictalurus punctatus]
MQDYAMPRQQEEESRWLQAGECSSKDVVDLVVLYQFIAGLLQGTVEWDHGIGHSLPPPLLDKAVQLGEPLIKKGRANPQVYIDLEIGNKPAGRLRMLLRADVVPMTADEDSFELHMVLLEQEDVEKQIRGLLDKQAKVLERRTVLETSCASTYTSKVPGILKKDERIGAVVLHVGANDIRLWQMEVLKRAITSLIKTVRGRSPTMKIIVSGPLPTQVELKSSVDFLL